MFALCLYDTLKGLDRQKHLNAIEMLIRSANNAAERKGKITINIVKLENFLVLKSEKLYLFQNYEETQSLVHIK